ncbi:3-deoxy-D-manno-octulosonic acid transferase [Desulfomarina profundi]|uniref:3-deoxy-D-manno-octulosonic acid transferase n=1 Tax=Desulfomarina profundi TaxID=2772557 RepID=A0A8D5JCY0_9BACT|nr:glycosyltransferase N-terminal domain-containing protein [Desulfomarina profundi]BCL60258.1 3-deoxy-D-manno-octulosonic acid transferase [Desulfomarina profundi]
MFILYCLLQLFFLPVLLLLIIPAMAIPKYRGRIPARLGAGLSAIIPASAASQKTIWVHALSVGEVTSAIPLLEGLRRDHPRHRIVFSIATRSGHTIARKLAANLVDYIIPSPIDLLPVVMLFVHRIRPMLFILVETDFWPGLLGYLRLKNIPAVLVNGRISEKSMKGYYRFRFFFRPLFRSFRYLFMQTEFDAKAMNTLGVGEKCIKTAGNLKFDTNILNNSAANELHSLFPSEKTLLIAGSTHPGEEEVLFQVFKTLRHSFPHLLLIVAPRNPNRKEEICSLAESLDLDIECRTSMNSSRSPIFLLDTIGELINFYSLSHIAFIGGSLVNYGGHNPVEPALFGIPVLFGPYMSDFHEIALSLLRAGGGLQVKDGNELQQSLESFLASDRKREKYGFAAQQCIQQQRGVINNHMEILNKLM